MPSGPSVAALELVDEMHALGRSLVGLDLRLRAGVLTGEAAVTVGAKGEGMVAGDLVNTASRLQTAAAPGAVLVGRSTYEASKEAIAYADSGDYTMKGKEAPVRAWRALRVVAGHRGFRRSEGLEPPFVARDEELRMMKELLHSVSREREAATALDHGHRWHRQVTADMGVFQVRRWSGGGKLLA
jgi:hypothetical protein